MGKSQKLGASNKFFFYSMCEYATASIRIKLTIPDLQIESMKNAVQKAIKRYPEFAIKIFVRNNVLESELLDDPIVFLPVGSEPQKYGTEKLNRYLFYFLYDENSITISYYHALSDVKGMLEFLRCAMYLYAGEVGFALTKDELEELLPTIREDGDFEKSDQKEDLLDPYHLYGDTSVTPDYVFPFHDAFVLPVSTDPEEVEYYHFARITMDLSKVLKLAKDYGVSVVPLINDIATNAIYNTFDVKDKPIITMLPVDQRPFVGSETIVNCSDSIFFAYTDEDHALKREDRVKKWRSELKQKATKNNFVVQMGYKAAAVDGFENDPTPIDEQVKTRNLLPPKGIPRPVSYGITYPGKMSLLSGLDRMLEDIELIGLVRGPVVIGHSFGNVLRFQVLERSDATTFADCIYGGFKDAGLEPEISHEGRYYFDILKIEELEHE